MRPPLQLKPSKCRARSSGWDLSAYVYHRSRQDDRCRGLGVIHSHPQADKICSTAELEWLKIAYMAVSVRESRTLNTRRPFSRADARKAGIALRELLSPRFHKIFYDCYVASTIPITTELRVEAALGISPPGSYVSHFSAAQLWGAIVPEVSDVHVTTVPGDAGRTVRR